jgi:Uma2 family endonuclease
MPGLKKAELLEAVVYMPSPVRVEQHGEPHLNLAFWLAAYKGMTNGVRGADNATVRLDLNNEPQPDALLFIDPARGGQARISDDGYLENAPELVAEVAASTAAFDLRVKFETYRRNQVREYLVWRVPDQAVDWFAWRQGQYEPLGPATDGLLKSEAFPGLWLDVPALLRGDVLALFDVVRQGAATPEHAAFVARLAAAP